jgi:hypothetical protein
VTIHRDGDLVAAFGLELFERYAAPTSTGELDDDIRAMVRAQAPKRVALQFSARASATWDHRKLASGVY